MTVHTKVVGGQKHYYMVVGGLHVPVPSSEIK